MRQAVERIALGLFQSAQSGDATLEVWNTGAKGAALLCEQFLPSIPVGFKIVYPTRGTQSSTNDFSLDSA
jgi:hypothetical protein